MLKPTIKRLIAVLLAVFMLILCTTGAYAAETPTEDEQPTHSPIYFGDITDDAVDKLTIGDVTLIQQYLVEVSLQQNIRTYTFTKDGTLMTQEELINYLCDVNKDGKADILDVTEIQKYIAECDTKNTNLGEIAFEWQDAEYESVYPTKTITVTDKEAYDEQKLVIDKETITIKHPIYKTGYECMCNDCDMALRWDDGTPYTMEEIRKHLSAHTNTNALPTLTPNLARYYVDAYGQQRPVSPGYKVGVTFRDENGNLYNKDMPYDESLPLYHGNGSHGSYRYSYCPRIPTGNYEEVTVPAKVPVYRSGEAYVATATGEVLYHADGTEWSAEEFGWFIERRHVDGVNKGLKGDSLIAYKGKIEKQWTDKIPTGQFTDTPLEGCYHYETVHHDAVTHTEEITDYDAEPIRKELIKEAGFYAVY